MSVGHGHIADAFVEWPGGRPDLPWCGDPPTDATTPAVEITEGTLNVRSGPGTHFDRVGELADRADLACAVPQLGSPVGGNAVWDQVAAGRYVADAYVRWQPDKPRYPWCGQAPATVPPASRAGVLRPRRPGRPGEHA